MRSRLERLQSVVILQVDGSTLPGHKSDNQDVYLVAVLSFGTANVTSSGEVISAATTKLAH